MREESRFDRHVLLEGGCNIRDLGGYRTTDGKVTRWRTLLRSGTMHALSVQSQGILVRFGVRTVIDLRTSFEMSRQPNVFKNSTSVTFYHHNMIGDVPINSTDDVGSGIAFTSRIPVMYKEFLDHRKDQIKDILVTLSGSDALPAMYHCSAGQDRTGIISAIILGNAGVPYDTIAEDYALTARYLIDRYFQGYSDPGQTPENYTWKQYQAQYCPPEAMMEVLEYLDEYYGGIYGYMVNIGLSRDQIVWLRNAILE